MPSAHAGACSLSLQGRITLPRNLAGRVIGFRSSSIQQSLIVLQLGPVGGASAGVGSTEVEAETDGEADADPGVDGEADADGEVEAEADGGGLVAADAVCTGATIAGATGSPHAVSTINAPPSAVTSGAFMEIH